MRDPNRLTSLYKTLESIHKNNIPDWRFLQFMDKAGDRKTDDVVIASPDSLYIDSEASLDPIGAGLIVGLGLGNILLHLLLRHGIDIDIRALVECFGPDALFRVRNDQCDACVNLVDLSLQKFYHLFRLLVVCRFAQDLMIRCDDSICSDHDNCIF